MTIDPLDPISGIPQVTRHHIRDVWQALRSGGAASLPESDRLLGDILQTHADDYGFDFSEADTVAPEDHPPEGEVNPFLHVSVHLAVERQLAEAEPREAVQFYNAMRRRQAGHHDTVHLIGAMYSALLYDVIHERRAFDMDRYRRLLHRCSALAPELVPQAVADAFDEDES